MSTLFQVVIVAGFHLFPFRTEKLSPPAPMVLHTRGRVGSRRLLERSPLVSWIKGLSVFEANGAYMAYEVIGEILGNFCGSLLFF